MDYDAEVLRRASNGDDDAFNALVASHLPRCSPVAFLITRNPDDASDALQEALFRVYRSLKNFTPGRPFYPWFAKIVAHEALKVGKRSSRRAVPIFLPEAVAEDTPEGTVLVREEQERLWQAIQALPPDQRAVIVLRYFAELSEQEMAEALHVRPGTVKSRLHRARVAQEQLFLSDTGVTSAKGVQPSPIRHGGAQS